MSLSAFHKYLIAGLIIAVSLVVASGVIFQAKAISKSQLEEKGITFPIEELGNCSSMEDCKRYCNQPENMEACMSFAREHGLMEESSPEKEEEVRKMSQVLQEEGGPGGCRTPGECRRYCNKISNLEECVQFAEEHGFGEDRMKEAKKVLEYVKQGGETPGGCRSRQECREYCSNPDHMKECAEFARKTGLQEDMGAEEMEKMSKFARLMKEGKTPGGCSTHRECQRYCSNPEHSQECFEFARKHNLMPKEEMKEMKEEMQEMTEELNRIPEEVKSCLESRLDTSLEKIRSGEVMPGPRFGEAMKVCSKRGVPSERGEARELPQEVISCVKDELGVDFEKSQAGAVSIHDHPEVIRRCFEKTRSGEHGPPTSSTDNFESPHEESERMRSEPPSPKEGARNSGSSPIENVPSPVKNCLKSETGKSLEELSRNPAGELMNLVQSCMESFMKSNGPGDGSSEQMRKYDENSLLQAANKLLGTLLGPVLE